MRIGMVLLEVVGMAVVNHRPLGRSVLNRWRRVRIFDGVQHSIEKVRPNGDIARPNLQHGLFGRIFAFNLLSLGLLGFGVVSLQNAVAEPFLLRSFQRGEEDSTESKGTASVQEPSQ
jgi:hypothetical protein